MTPLPHLLAERQRFLTRRWFFRDCGVGLGAVALNGLLAADGRAEPGSLPKPHFPPKAKRVIYLFMGGAPSHLELFDNKPQLAKFNGTLPPPGTTCRQDRPPFSAPKPPGGVATGGGAMAGLVS